MFDHLEDDIATANPDGPPPHLVDSLCEFDFMKCQKCGRICTNTEIVAALGPGGTGEICTCGSLKYSPYQIDWTDYALPQVIRYARAGLGFTDEQVRADLWLEAGLAGRSFLGRVVALARLWWAQRQVAR
ncbi:MAG TPA: hypothetical protein VEA16_21950 [Vicinamibacterales bacterium]|nr:hypothetical protein [Vicinamibacterales bacterium]